MCGVCVGKLAFLGSVSRSSRFYHLTQLAYIIFIQPNSAGADLGILRGGAGGGGVLGRNSSRGGG